ncbi:amidohydrolase family protein [Nocardia gamkensis]|uniref:amidohydrolase family protein n=1 Tax=Nocardia gamkensis TaxID=352869 RepID=UPI0036E8D03C
MNDTDITLVCANSHLIETPDVFHGRMPSKWIDRAPSVKVVDGGAFWIFEDAVFPLYRSCAVAGMSPEDWLKTPYVTIDDIREGCYDPRARLADMDVEGVTATTLYSSPAGIGFGGDLFAHAKDDPELGIAAMRAWNDWYFDTWISTAPDRFIPIQATWYHDPTVAAAEVYRNAERGFKGVALRNPTDIGLPWLGDDLWDPFLRACQETGTVISHHTESLSHWPNVTPDLEKSIPYGYRSTLFQSSALEVVTSWIWAGLGVRFPGLKVTIAESGGSWLPHLIERLEWCLDYSLLHRQGWPDMDRRPLDMLRETYSFSTLESHTAYKLSQELDFHNWMIEGDYPHMESVWPNTRPHHQAALEGVDLAFVEAITWKNVSTLYDFPITTTEVSHV